MRYFSLQKAVLEYDDMKLAEAILGRISLEGSKGPSRLTDLLCKVLALGKSKSLAP
jgi:hypothetical protein